MFKRICTVTYRVADVERSADAICRFFGYQETARGALSLALATAWGAPNAAGRPVRELRPPEAAIDFCIRLVEGPKVPGYAPLRTTGWNAAELLVTDVHALAGRLTDSPFRILGGPRDLMDNGVAIALQVAGPGDEVFYLTELNGEPMQRTYGAATLPVDRLFIAVLGASTPAASRDFYQRYVKGITRPRRFAIRVLSNAHGLEPDTTRYEIGAACLEEQYRIEIDGYPESAVARPVPPGDLPPGLAMVSFRTQSLDALDQKTPVSSGPEDALYRGARLARLAGPDGEWLELIEET